MLPREVGVRTPLGDVGNTLPHCLARGEHPTDVSVDKDKREHGMSIPVLGSRVRAESQSLVQGDRCRMRTAMLFRRWWRCVAWGWALGAPRCSASASVPLSSIGR